MNFGISTCMFQNCVLSIEHLQRLQSSGYRHIELFANRPTFDYHNRLFYREISDWFQSADITSRSLHLPFVEHIGTKNARWISALASERRDREAAMDELKRALELCDFMSVSYLVVHFGITGQRFLPIVFDYAYAMIEMIRTFTDAEILIENIPNEISSIPRIKEFIQVTDLSKVRVCYDSGHGHLQGPTPDLKQVGAIHLNDNDRLLDNHLWPFEGKIDWSGLMNAIVSSGFQGPLVFETADQNAEFGWNCASRLEVLMSEAQSSQDELRKPDGLRRNNGDDLH